MKHSRYLWFRGGGRSGERECQKVRRGQRREGKGAAFLGFPRGPGREHCRQREAGVRSRVVLALPPQTGISSRWVYRALIQSSSPPLGVLECIPHREGRNHHTVESSSLTHPSRLFSEFIHAKQSLSLSLAKQDISLRLRFLRQHKTLRKELCPGLLL